jgi:hypothetical protein
VKRIGAVALLALSALGVHPRAARGQDFNEVGSLRGLTFLAVTVTQTGDRSAPLRPLLTPDRIKTVIELELRRNGIRVAEKPLVGTDLQLPNQAYADLLLDLSSIPAGASGIAASLSLELRQWVTIRGQRVEAATWGRRNIVQGTASSIAEQVTAAVREFVEDFLNDYLKANPKR